MSYLVDNEQSDNQEYLTKVANLTNSHSPSYPSITLDNKQEIIDILFQSTITNDQKENKLNIDPKANLQSIRAKRKAQKSAQKKEVKTKIKSVYQVVIPPNQKNFRAGN